MKFLTKAWMQTQFENFADRILAVFAKKTETENHYTQKAAYGILGHVKLSNSAAITTTGEYALDAVEKNASVEGTLANLIQQTNSNLGWKELVLNKSFTNIDEELIIETENIFKTEFYNDVWLLIGIETISKTNVLLNVSLPIAPIGILYNNNEMLYEGDAYKYGTQIKLIIRNTVNVNIDSLKVKSIYYK